MAMFEQTLLEGLRKVGGYQGSAVTDAGGEILFEDRGSLAGDLDMAVLTFNGIFMEATKASKEIGLGQTSIITINTEKSIILMMCSGEQQRTHIHMAMVIDQEAGNLGLAKLAMKQTMPKIVESLEA